MPGNRQPIGEVGFFVAWRLCASLPKTAYGRLDVHNKRSLHMATERTVDHSALRTNQTFIIALLSVAFVLNTPLLVGFVALVMLVGALCPAAGLFMRVYRHILRPLGVVQPDVVPDNPEPHRFAQGLGGSFTALSFVALLAGYAALGWALAWMVIVLAALNLFLGWCAGCTMYYWLNRLGVPGFEHRPPEATR